jgi:hypothetical protein
MKTTSTAADESNAAAGNTKNPRLDETTEPVAVLTAMGPAVDFCGDIARPARRTSTLSIASGIGVSAAGETDTAIPHRFTETGPMRPSGFAPRASS